MKVQDLFEDGGTTSGSITTSIGSVGTVLSRNGPRKRARKRPRAVDATLVNSFNLESKNSETTLIK